MHPSLLPQRPGARRAMARAVVLAAAATLCQAATLSAHATAEGCADDEAWRDSEHGDGKGSCSDVRAHPEYCTDYGYGADMLARPRC